MIRVVLCAHNGGRFIEAQLASIMEQELPVDCVHVFDFASTDDTRPLLARLAARWPKLDVHLVDDAPGVTMSFQRAFTDVLPLCGDRDVIFLSDQDDVWLPRKTAIMVSRVEEARCDSTDRLLAFHDVKLCDANLQVIRHSFYEGRPFRVPRDLDPRRLMIANPVIGHTIAITTPLVRTMLRCQRLHHYVMHDWALVLLATHVGRILYQPDQLGLYRQHDSNVLGAGRRRSIVSYLRRALWLSRSINVQAATFIEDVRCAAEEADMAEPTSPLPGAGPLAWRLGASMARHGHTIWHRMLALTQARYLFSTERDAAKH